MCKATLRDVYYLDSIDTIYPVYGDGECKELDTLKQADTLTIKVQKETVRAFIKHHHYLQYNTIKPILE